jgi:hypothetical protein
MNTKLLRCFLPCALMLVSLPVFAQSARFITEGPAFAFAEDQLFTERVIDNVIGAPVGEGAQIVFFRPDDKHLGNTNLSEGDRLLAELPSDSYYAIAVTPGIHTYAVDGRPLQLQLAPGERRFVRISNRATNPRLLPSRALTFLRVSLGQTPPLY